MNPLQLTRILTFMTAAAVICLGTARAEEATNTIKFSDPSKPGTLKIVTAQGSIRIEASDNPEVVIKSAAQPRQRPRKDGLRVLTEAASYALAEKNNVVTVDAASEGWMGNPSDFRISVPRSTNVIISNSLGGEVTCTGIDGNVEIKSLHGEVRLNDVGGGVLVETMNGEISASIRELHEGKPLSFTSMNGQVIVRVPAQAKADVRLRTQNGTILTDFDDKALVTKVEATAGRLRRGTGHVFTPEAREALRRASADIARAGSELGRHAAEAAREAVEAAREGADAVAQKPEAPEPPDTDDVPPIPPVPAIPAIPAVTGGKLVTGKLNGGGPEINVATMNGDVTLRQLEAK